MILYIASNYRKNVRPNFQIAQLMFAVNMSNICHYRRRLTWSVRDVLYLLLLSQLHLNLPEHGEGELHQLHDLFDEPNIIFRGQY